ncbi:hypothetical protein Tco_1312350 [Tanacetum coccineum]
MEEDYEPSVQSQRRVNPKIHDVIKKEVEKLLDAGLIYPHLDSPWERLNESHPKRTLPLPFLDPNVGKLAGNQFTIVSSHGFSELFFRIPLPQKIKEKTNLYLPHMNFRPIVQCLLGYAMLRGIPTMYDGLFQILIEKTMEVFMDDFSVFGDSFSTCLSHLEKMLKRCEDTNLSLN